MMHPANKAAVVWSSHRIAFPAVNQQGQHQGKIWLSSHLHMQQVSTAGVMSCADRLQAEACELRNACLRHEPAHKLVWLQELCSHRVARQVLDHVVGNLRACMKGSDQNCTSPAGDDSHDASEQEALAAALPLAELTRQNRLRIAADCG